MFSELTDVCKEATEGVEEEAVTELDAVDAPGIWCVQNNELQAAL